MPVADAAVASGVEAANQMKMQQLAGGATGATDAAQLNQAGAALAGAAGQQQLAQSQQAVQRPIAAAANVVAARRSDAQAAVAGRELAVAAAQRGNELKLASMDSDLKRELVDARTQFATDEAGRLVLNQQQLADLAISKAKSREELATKLQYMEQASKKRLLAVDLMYKKAMQDLDARTKQAIQSGNQQAIAAVAEYKNQIMSQFQAEVADAQNKAMKNGAIWATLGALGGGALAYYYSNGDMTATAAGAAAGAKVGEGGSKSGLLPELA